MIRQLALGAHYTAMKLCCQVAVANRFFKLPMSRLMSRLDDVSLVYSAVVALTNTIKFFVYLVRGKYALRYNTLNEQQDVDKWIQVPLLDYLPRINQFSSFYYGLMLLTNNTALSWHIYMRFFRKDIRDERLPFNPSVEAFRFFLDRSNSLRISPNYQDFQRTNLLREHRDEIIARATRIAKPEVRPIMCERGGSYLTRMHVKKPLPSSKPTVQINPYPIGRMDLLHDKSENRWRFMAWHVYMFTIGLILMTLPLVYLTLMGFESVNNKFGPKILLSATGHRRLFSINLILSYYGRFEQLFAIFQYSRFFVFTNIIIKLMHADLVYKARYVDSELAIICRLYMMEAINTLPIAQIQRQEWRVYSYFHQIKVLDSYLSDYCTAALCSFIVGVVFGLNFIGINDPSMLMGTYAFMASHVISFMFLKLVSSRVERASRPLFKRIFGILARESDTMAKKDWQRILDGFNRRPEKRQFEMIGNFSVFGALSSLIGFGLLIKKQVTTNWW